MDGATAAPPRSGRLIGIDLGSVRIGVAVSDSAQHIALAHEVLQRTGDLAADRLAIAGIVEEFGACGVVVGVPLSLSGDIGPAARAALGEIDELAKLLAIPVAVIDERLSTVEATRRRREVGKHRRRAVDDGAAAVLLQAYLDRRQAGAGR